MIVHDRFAIGHIPRTGGDALHQIFDEVRKLTPCHVDDTGGHNKHDSFNDRKITNKKTLVLIIRRLPSWFLSFAQLAHHHGIYPTYRQMLPPATEDYIDVNSDYGKEYLLEFPGPWATLPDRYIKYFTTNVKIDRWFQMETLRQEILEFLEDYVHVSKKMRIAILGVRTKPIMPYDHDVYSYFTSRQIEKMYKNNPLWEKAEVEAYGSPFQPW